MNTATKILLHHHQAEWTRPMRRELYRRTKLAVRSDVLDLGCGGGLITREMAGICRGKVMGVDRDPEMIAAANEKGGADFHRASAYSLPFAKSSFDLAACHWLFLWLDNPGRALAEIRRVLRPGGLLLIACEPDYGGRVVHPEEAELKEEIIRALAAEGADPLIGRKLPALAKAAGFSARAGLYPGTWTGSIDREIIEREMQWLAGVLSAHAPPEKLERAFKSLQKAHAQGTLFMHTPVVWLIGTAPARVF